MHIVSVPGDHYRLLTFLGAVFPGIGTYCHKGSNHTIYANIGVLM